MTLKQLRFAQEYLIDLNATKAAERAGYSKRTARDIGWENLTKPDIAEEIEKLFRARSMKVGKDAEWVLRELIANHEVARAIGNLGQSNRALELIGKHLGMFTESVQHEGEIHLNIITGIDAAVGSQLGCGGA